MHTPCLFLRALSSAIRISPFVIEDLRGAVVANKVNASPACKLGKYRLYFFAIFF
jgi:hypothetical protein